MKEDDRRRRSARASARLCFTVFAQLAYCRFLDDDAVVALTESLSSLQRLDLGGNKLVTARGMLAIAACPAATAPTRSLSTGGAPTPSSALKALDLRFSNMTNEMLQALVSRRRCCCCSSTLNGGTRARQCRVPSTTTPAPVAYCPSVCVCARACAI